MSTFICAPDDFYDAHLAFAELKDNAEKGPILELVFSVGSEYKYAKQGIFLKARDGEPDWAEEKRKTALELIKRNFPSAVVGSCISLPALINPSKEITDAVVRIKVTSDGEFSKAVMVESKQKAKVSREEAVNGAKSLMTKNRALLASLGFTCEGGANGDGGATGGGNPPTSSKEVGDLPF